MNGSRRTLKVSKEIRQIVSQYLVSHLNEPDLGLVSLTEVQVSPDLRSAKAFISFINCELPEQEALEIVQSKAKQIQSLLGSKIRMKFCPKIKFVIDQGLENAFKVSSLLKEAGVDSQAENLNTEEMISPTNESE